MLPASSPSMDNYTLCPEKKTKMFFVISPISSGDADEIWHTNPEEICCKMIECCSPHLNNVSTLPCET